MKRRRRNRSASAQESNQFPKRKPLLFAYSHHANGSGLHLGAPADGTPRHLGNEVFVFVRPATVLWLRNPPNLPSDACPPVLVRRTNSMSPIPASKEHRHVLRQCLMPRDASAFTRRYFFDVGLESLRLQRSYRCCQRFPFNGVDSNGARSLNSKRWYIHRLW